MIKQKFQAVILAAGKSTRFNTTKSKMLHKICGQEMFMYAVKCVENISETTILVLNDQKNEFQEVLDKYKPKTTIIQVEQKVASGTAGALMTARESLTAENIIVINGDMPLLKPEIVQELLNVSQNENSDIAFLVSEIKDGNPQGYGRIIESNNRVFVVEEKNLKPEEKSIKMINAGLYVFKLSVIESIIDNLPERENGEYYITDILNLASAEGKKVVGIAVDFEYVRGVNTLKELYVVDQIKRSQIINKHMENGVRFISPNTNNIDVNVQIESGAVIYPGAQIYGECKIGSQANILPYSIIEDSILENNTKVGPFAHIHNNSHVLENAVIGNFVETSATTFGKNSKAKHLAYLGNAIIKEKVTIGAGTITCNYNGVKKNKTEICDGAFIGSNSCLIAPIKIGRNALVAAGSAITEDVPDNALAITRSSQINKEEYANKIRDKYSHTDTIL